jgi:fructose-1,6-bisphosphatase-3
MNHIKYLELLAHDYPSIQLASAEIINLRAMLHLPKGTEHFMSDLHGESESFLHILKNCSGVIRIKIDDLFAHTLAEPERKSLATLIYYPEQKLEICKQEEKNLDEWYKITLYRLIEICRLIVSKYTRTQVNESLPEEFKFLIDELLYMRADMMNKKQYYEEIIDSIISHEQADSFIVVISKLIQRISIDRLHILGDIFDRGPGADGILDALMAYHSVDIQWGNHDILWMGAAAGSEACIANVLRVCTRYDNLHTVEDGYGISIRPLLTFAIDTYRNDPCANFVPIESSDDIFNQSDVEVLAKVHKAISIIQFKLEGQIINRRKEFEMEDEALLHRINYTDGTITIGNKTYKLNDCAFPTIDPADPYRLTSEEAYVMERLRFAFSHSEKLKSHIQFLYAKGDMYLAYNNNLLFHGCIPMMKNGEFDALATPQGEVSGKDLLDFTSRAVRQAYFSKKDTPERRYSLDLFWYLWCGKKSPLYGKNKMATFARYFIDEKETWAEQQNHYYDYIDDPKVCQKILAEFGLGADGHIVNGHVPVNKGQSPVRAGGKLLIIDGGFSRAYHKKTGIAGYTLIYNSNELRLSSHEPFESTAKAIEEEKDIHSTSIVLEKNKERRLVKHTDRGEEIRKKIEDLELLLAAYREGIIKER